MKVLLRRNVPKLGGVGDVVLVRPGYARNYLLPYGLAIEPTEANIKGLESEKQARLVAEAQTRKELEALAAKIKAIELTIPARANEQGHLFGAVHAKEIVAALTEEGYIVQEHAVELAEPIRQLDRYDVPIRLAEDLAVNIVVWVVPEKAAEGEAGAGAPAGEAAPEPAAEGQES
jgi:large subunit ribosomal protein L9